MSAAIAENLAGPSAAGMERKLRRAWRRQRRFVRVRGLCYLLIGAALLLALDFALDWTWELPASGRTMLLCVNAAVLAAVFYGSWWRALTRFDAVRVALQVEAVFPELKSLLISHVQLSDAAGEGSGISRGLVRAMRHQAVEQARPLDFGRIVRFRALRRAAVTCLVFVAIVAGTSLAQPAMMKVFLARMGNPHSMLRYPTRTTIEPLTRGRDLPEGEPIMLSVRASGEIPAEATLMLWQLGGARSALRVPAGKIGRPHTRDFAYDLKEAYHSFSYSFRVGDAVSEKYDVRVIPPPRVEPRVSITYPKYTRRPPHETDSLNCEVLEGSQVDWTLRSNRPLSTAEMLPDGSPPVRLAVSDDGLTIRYRRAPGRSFSYSFRWTDREHHFVYAPATRYALSVVPDHPPKVTLLSPSQDEKATVRKEVNLAFQAEDDFGVAAARLVYSREGQETPSGAAVVEKSINICTFDHQPLKSPQEKFRWRTQASLPDLKPGDVVRYAVEVLDNRAGAPGVTRSETRRLIIVTPEEYVRLVMEERNRLLSKIKELHAEETRAADAVLQLGDQPGEDVKSK